MEFVGQITTVAICVIALGAGCAIALIVLHVRASRRGEPFEGQIKAASFSFSLKHTAPPRDPRP